VANSLLVIKKLVFEEKQITFAGLVDVIGKDWSGSEELRRRIQTRFDFYGNDSAEADAMVQRVFDAFVDMVEQVKERYGVLRPAGISTFGREMSQFRENRGATATGHRKGDILSGHFSPTPGTDKNGPTAVIRSHCAVNMERLPSGTALDLKVLPSSARGEEGTGALVGMMKGFVELGGLYLQIDVVDTAMLRDAQEHPEKYPNLSVRVAGWSARFASLDRNWQELIIVRTQQEFK
jgi:formate C-acetyltransferase